ncbi:MAG: ribbon-helix-helix domain-containing protein, partial [Roseomonas mucosa]|nr:ribbon-helix-helix domain-containing protein [Roseomonas mucosa]
RTSVALEPDFWTALEGMAHRRSLPLARLVSEVAAARTETGMPLASSLRLLALADARKAARGGEPA